MGRPSAVKSEKDDESPFPPSITGLKAGMVGCVALVYGSPWHRISLKRIDEAVAQRRAK